MNSIHFFLFFLQGAMLALPSVVLPSPYKVYLVSQSLVNGWRRTIPAVLIPLLTDGPIIIFSLLLLHRVPFWALNLLRILGGLLIFAIAIRIIRLWRSGELTVQASESSARQRLREVLAVKVITPNPFIIWGIVAGPIVLEGWQNYSAIVGLGYILGFYIVFVVGLAALVLTFGIAGQLNPTINRILSIVAAATLLILGGWQIIVGFWELVG